MIMRKAWPIFLNALPVLAMIALIPSVADDYVLTLVYAVIILIALAVKRTPHDLTVLLFGFVMMILFEYIFVSTGVETFQRRTLLGAMPLWLPFLWAYGFVAIKRSVEVLSARA